MKKQRKQYAPEEKVAILRRHLLEKEPISKLCDEVGFQPTVFYRWPHSLELYSYRSATTGSTRIARRAGG